MRTNNQLNFNLLWYDALSNYPVSLQQEVFAAVIKYAATGSLPTLNDPRAQIAFDFIRTEIDANHVASENASAQVSIPSKQSEPALSPACFESEEKEPMKKAYSNELSSTCDDMYEDYEDDEDYEDYEDYEDDEDEEDDDYEDYSDYGYDPMDYFDSLRGFGPIMKSTDIDDFDRICSLESASKSCDDEKTQPDETDAEPVEMKKADTGTIRNIPQSMDSLRHDLRQLKKKFRLPLSAKLLNKAKGISGGAICNRAGPPQNPNATLST
ncbi:MAG: hypothetical protein K2M11_07590 [Paramuribaculum sp.]|nr:hypothetical protein [Paramuribaculum sp.]